MLVLLPVRSQDSFPVGRRTVTDSGQEKARHTLGPAEVGDSGSGKEGARMDIRHGWIPSPGTVGTKFGE